MAAVTVKIKRQERSLILRFFSNNNQRNHSLLYICKENPNLIFFIFCLYNFIIINLRHKNSNIV